VARAKRIILALVLLTIALLLSAVLVNGGAGLVYVLPTLVPTVAVPKRSPGTATVVPPTASPSPTSVPTSRPTATRIPSPTATSTATPAPTPTATSTATPAPTPTSTLTPTPFSLAPPTLVGVTPTLSDTTPIPTAVPVAEMVPGTINIVVLGSDHRPDWKDWHTDVVQIVSIQPLVPAVTVLSIPRDLYVYVPEFGMSRVNFADMYGELYGYEGGGPGLLQQTLLYNLGIPVDHYVRTDFDGFIGIIDALEGVDIPVHCRLEDHWPYPDENGEYPIKVLEPGMHHMDGETALWYARSRMTSSVFARERRQQQVLQAIWRKSRSLDLLPRVPQLWEPLRSMVVTDLAFGDTVTLAEVAFRLDEQNVRFRNIGYQHVIPWTTPKGGFVFLPNWEEIGPVVTEALGPVPEGRLWRTLQRVEVWNGTGNGGWDQLAADRLLREGFVAVIGQPDRRDYAQTQLIDLTSTAKGGAAPHLRSMFGVTPENVIAAPDPNAAADYRLIVGADYQTCRSP
jgi:LCP family protein required for cell wall assembly